MKCISKNCDGEMVVLSRARDYKIFVCEKCRMKTSKDIDQPLTPEL